MTEILERLRAALADRYVVERELGEGGMAIVYLAHDVKHERHVAIKVLRPELAASLGADRFLREIKIAAKLTHPHILPLYDSGEADGLLFYVMPFVEGESLRDLLDREQQLPLEDAVRIAREVAGALSQAHSFGIIHRDIKPENVMLSGGHAVVSDFGIARAFSAAGGDNLTQTGMAVGTPAYMSPEQAAGDPSVDGRSDVYSLGCMLYEMLAGQIPFTGPNAQAIMARHTMDAVTPPSIMRQSVPAELEDVILRAMEKAPADRFRTAGDFADALVSLDSGTYSPRRTTRAMVAPRRKRMSSGATLAVSAVALVGLGIAGWQLWPSGGGGVAFASGGLDARNVAVLYFEDRTPDLELEHVADGLTEGLIQRLSRVPQLQVVSRNGVLPFKRGLVASDSIARLLEVGSLIEGVVDQVGDKVRVTVYLLDGNSGANLYREGFEIPSGDVLAARDSVIDVASRFLRERLGEEVRTRQLRAGANDNAAWLLVQRSERLRGDAFEHEEEEPDRAIEMYLEADSLAAIAADRDPAWAEPVVLRGWISYDLAFSAESRQEAIERRETAVQLATEAIARDQTYADAHHLRGRTRYVLFRMEITPNEREQTQLLEAARTDLETAVDLDPTLANAWYALSNLHYDRQDNISAVMAAREAYEADAFLANMDENLFQLYQTHYDLEQFPDADAWCNEGARRFPRDFRFVECRLAMLITPWAAVDVNRAWRLATEVDSLARDEHNELAGLRARMWVAGVLARANMPDSARAVISSARADPGVDPDLRLVSGEAVIRVMLGENDEAIRLLQRYVAANPAHRLSADRDLHWWWRPLREHPDFRAVSGH